LLRATDAEGVREAWRRIEANASSTLDRARALPEAKLHESVDGEWSYVQTLRHLVFATDRWITGPVLGEQHPFHRMGLPNQDPEPWRGIWIEADARPSLAEVLPVRAERMDSVCTLLDAADGNDLRRTVVSPNGGTTSVLGCVHVVLAEEWAHNRYATRDLAILEAK
jgi:hypothetical protein